jgi:general secretion pathway protein D
VLLAYATASLPVIAQETSASTVAEQPAATQSAENGAFTINMREADIRAFIQWIADRTQKNIIVHRSVAGTVTVISSRPIAADEAYELFLTVLQLNGFSAVENGNTVKVVSNADAKTSNTPFEGRESWQGETVTSIIDIDHSDAGQLVAALRPLVPASAHLAAYSPTNVIIASDTARGVDKINQLIAVLDKQQGEIDLEIVPVIHASAQDIVSVLKSVITALSRGKAGEANAAEKLEFAVDKRSNSVIITGNKNKRTQIKQLIARLDTPLEGNGGAQVVYLNYIDANEIAPILKSIGESALKDSKAENTKNFSIESSEATNALVISAPQGLMNTLRSVIEQLDIQRAQVLIEAIVVQVSGNAGDDFGIIWGSGDLYEENRTGGVAAVNTEANNTSIRDVIGSSLGATNTTSSLTDNQKLAAGLLGNSGLTFGYLEDGNLVAVLQAIASRNKSNIMSSPTIVALDNEEASLLVGQNVPFITGSSTSSGSSVNNPFQTIERQDVGITLNVTPRINQGDSVTLEVEQTIESVSSTVVSGAADLITDKAEMKTTALIKDGQVLVIGGLIREDEVENRTQVPFLGDIPLLGRLFRSHSVSKTKSNLMVFIQPTILKDQLQITGLTAQRYAFMREKQLQKAMAAFIRYSDHPLLEEFETYSPSATTSAKDTDTSSPINSNEEPAKNP